jgi:hypothetical protein
MERLVRAHAIRWAMALGGLLMAIMLPMLVTAHGGGVPVIAAEPAGPYRLYAWIDPDPLVVGVVHLTVAVTKPVGEREQPVTGARVDATFAQTGGVPLARTANEAASGQPGYYEADVEIGETGEWQVTVQVEGAEGVGTSSFSVTVLPAAGGNALMTWFGVGAIVIGIILLGVAIARRGPQPPRHPKR